MEGSNCINHIDINTFDFDITVKMIKVAYSLDLLDYLNDYSDSLFERSKHIIKNDKKGYMCYNYSNKPLIYYYGYSLIMKGTAFKKSKNFIASRNVISMYADLSWFPGMNEKTRDYVERFAFFAKANILELELLSGNQEVMDDYLFFLENNPSEYLTGISSILEAATTHGFDIEHVLAKMPEDPIEHFKLYNNPDSVDNTYFCSFLNQLVLYYMSRAQHRSAVDHTLRLLRLVDSIDNIRWYKRAIGLFEVLKDFASYGQLEEYRNIILKGVVPDEKNVDRNVCKFIDL